MKLIVAAVLALVLAHQGSAAPQFRTPFAQPQYQARSQSGYEGNAAILRSDSEVNEQGFRYAYETENGIQAQESGVEANGIQAQGAYSYTGDDGQQYSVTYVADANGFQPSGAHLPTPPPIPQEIVEALARNAQDEANGIFDDGSYYEGKYGAAGSGVAVARAQPSFRQTNRQNQFRF